MSKTTFFFTLIAIILMLSSFDVTRAQCVPRTDWTNTYTIVRGDTLFGIAQRFAITSTALAQGNCLTDPNRIYAGQILRVPGNTSNYPLVARIPANTNLYETPTSTTALFTVQPSIVTVVGRSSDTNWVFIHVSNVRGWVSSYAVELDSTFINRLPIVDHRGGLDGPGNTGCNQTLVSRLTIGTRARVLPGTPNNVRSTSSVSGLLVGTLPGDSQFTVIGGPQCADGILWWQIQAGSLIGWTGELQGNLYWVEPINASEVVTGTVTAYVLNVRKGPSAWATILTRIRQWERYPVIGRLADSSWLQVNVNGTVGWVNARYMTATNLTSVPIASQ